MQVSDDSSPLIKRAETEEAVITTEVSNSLKLKLMPAQDVPKIKAQKQISPLKKSVASSKPKIALEKSGSMGVKVSVIVSPSAAAQQSQLFSSLNRPSVQSQVKAALAPVENKYSTKTKLNTSQGHRSKINHPLFHTTGVNMHSSPRGHN